MDNLARKSRAALSFPGRKRPSRHPLAVALELGKFRLSLMVLLTAAAGYHLAQPLPYDWARFSWTLLGTLLCALGANGLNQWLERDRDARMQRTRRRPLPSGRLSPERALILSQCLSVAGIVILLTLAGAQAAALAALTIILYALVYTPLKRISIHNTLVGAVVGALPPLIGWSAAVGRLEMGALILGAIVFCWQMPHFMGLAWLYREDYARGGFAMLPVVEPDGRGTGLQALLFALALIPIGASLSLTAATGWLYAAGAAVLGALLSYCALRFARSRSNADARGMYIASLAYLPLLLLLMAFDPTRPELVREPAAPQAVSSVVELVASSQLP